MATMMPPTTDTQDQTRPKRIQRMRTKGWRMPAGAIYVGRPTRWGNPYVAKQSERFAGMDGVWFVADGANNTWTPEVDDKKAAVDLAVSIYRGNVGGFWNEGFRKHIRAELAGRDLACWCPLDQPCHADVLLEIANPAPTAAGGRDD